MPKTFTSLSAKAGVRDAAAVTAPPLTTADEISDRPHRCYCRTRLMDYAAACGYQAFPHSRLRADPAPLVHNGGAYSCVCGIRRRSGWRASVRVASERAW